MLILAVALYRAHLATTAHAFDSLHVKNIHNFLHCFFFTASDIFYRGPFTSLDF